MPDFIVRPFFLGGGLFSLQDYYLALTAALLELFFANFLINDSICVLFLGKKKI